MASTQQSMSQEARAREKRATVKEDLVNVASGAREKVDHARADAQKVVEKALHPFDEEAKEKADQKAELKKYEATVKQQEIRDLARHQAEEEKIAAMAQTGQRTEAVQSPPVKATPPGGHPQQSPYLDPDAPQQGRLGESWKATQEQPPASPNQGFQSALGTAGYGTVRGSDTSSPRGTAVETSPKGTPAPPNYHNPFH